MTRSTRQWTGILSGLLIASVVCCVALMRQKPSSRAFAEIISPRISTTNEDERFQEILASKENLQYDEFLAQTPERDFLKELSFDPAKVPFYDQAVKRLNLTEEEIEIFKTNGFVSVDHGRPYSFASLYYSIYSHDLPVLITTDSILHAMHRSYDDILMEIEVEFLGPAIGQILASTHQQLASDSGASSRETLSQSYRDVDLYLTVAANLLKGAGAPRAESVGPADDTWTGGLLVASKLGQDQQVLEILSKVQALLLENPNNGECTSIYGGSRMVDYSQFKPRGHYSKQLELARYFRAMMWIGRMDTGFNILPPHPESGIDADSSREMLDAVLLADLLRKTDAVHSLWKIDEIIELFVGQSDSLSVFQLLEILDEHQIAEIEEAARPETIKALQDAIASRGSAEQRIRSQTVISDPYGKSTVPPPAVFQFFGQRFAVDSFVLSQVVYDSVFDGGRKIRRMMPTGLDVMVALGNHQSVPLLADEMARFQYAANLAACRQYIDSQPAQFWRSNLYNIWLGALRWLDEDMTNTQHCPEVMRTAVWQRKQLQTQLASWSELRHNTILYSKQSFTGFPACEYPAGYVEPYPEVYAAVKRFADEAARRIEAADYSLGHASPTELSLSVKSRQIEFFREMSSIVGRLEDLARKELKAEPFTDDDQKWLKKTIDRRGGGSGGPRYSGWYPQLFYGGGQRAQEYEPTIVDVHTDPQSSRALQVGVGDCNFLVVAIDNEQDRMVYVGPTYSYYEFQQPSDNRLTDEQWSKMINDGEAPPRPRWTDVFHSKGHNERLKDRKQQDVDKQGEIN